MSPAPFLPPAQRVFLLLTSVLVGAAIMTVEVVGAKVLSPYVGTSHFVWTAQITVVLLALSLGYGLGGWWVDRAPRPRWLFAALLGAAAWLALGSVLTPVVAPLAVRGGLATGSLLAAAVLYFIPLSLMAVTGPFLVRMLTASVEQVGTSAGRLTALSTLGSVAGTVVSSYVVAPYLPNSQALLATAGVLAVLALAHFTAWERRGLPVAVLVVLSGVGAAQAGEDPYPPPQGMTELFRGNSPFGLQQVVQDASGRRRYYLNDWLTQNSFDPVTGRSLSVFTHMLEALVQGYAPPVQRALCIGMGIGVVPSSLARQGAQVDVVEINPATVELAQRFFDLDPARFTLHVADGRVFLQDLAPRYDVVVMDAFVGDSLPSHLMSVEAFGQVARALAPGGILVMNAFGSLEEGRDFQLGSIHKTLSAVFGSVRLHPASNGNAFFVAAVEPGLDWKRNPDIGQAPVHLRQTLRDALLGARVPRPEAGQLLTDDFNPLEFFDAGSRENLRRTLAQAHVSAPAN